jgi:uncharacterized damage-inducible protein DinB
MMTENILVKIFKHNNWANKRIIQVCSALSDELLDAEPQSATKGTIRRTLRHLVGSQQHYISLLTGIKPRFDWQAFPPFAELLESASISGEELLALARDVSGKLPQANLQTEDGYSVEPWVVMVQAINHATEHREQIKSMLSSLGVTPPEMDGWTYGEVTNAITPPPT